MSAHVESRADCAHVTCCSCGGQPRFDDGSLLPLRRSKTRKRTCRQCADWQSRATRLHQRCASSIPPRCWPESSNSRRLAEAVGEFLGLASSCFDVAPIPVRAVRTPFPAQTTSAPQLPLQPRSLCPHAIPSAVICSIPSHCFECIPHAQASPPLTGTPPVPIACFTLILQPGCLSRVCHRTIWQLLRQHHRALHPSHPLTLPSPTEGLSLGATTSACAAFFTPWVSSSLQLSPVTCKAIRAACPPTLQADTNVLRSNGMRQS